MKLSKFSCVFLTIVLLLVASESKKIRLRHKHRDVTPTGWLKAAAQGFLSGVSGASGEEINKCLPSSWQGNYFKLDTEKEEADERGKTLTLWQKIMTVLKFALDLACAFKDQIKKLFGFSRRRRSIRRRRFFYTKAQRRGLFDWIQKAIDAIKSAFSSVTDWIKVQWNNFKEWTKEKWAEVKTWAQNVWDDFLKTIDGIKERCKEFLEKVKNWVINKVVPILAAVMNCISIVLSIVGTIIAIVSSVLQILAGNLLKIADMIINLICNYQTILDVKLFFYF